MELIAYIFLYGLLVALAYLYGRSTIKTEFNEDVIQVLENARKLKEEINKRYDSYTPEQLHDKLQEYERK